MQVKQFLTGLVVIIYNICCTILRMYISFSMPYCVQEEELQEMRHSAEQLEQQYGHLVNRVLVKEGSTSACAELRSILEGLEREPQWVPVSWVRT